MLFIATEPLSEQAIHEMLSLLYIKYSVPCASQPSTHIEAGHYRTTSETPFEWRFAGNPIGVRDSMLAARVSDV